MPSKIDTDKLLADHKRLIESEAYKYSSHIPYSLALVEAYKLAREAANDFDPKLGYKFSTYLVNKLQKLSRTSTQYGGAVRLPEDKQFKMQKLNTAEEELLATLNRPPSVAELADATGFSLKVINDLLQNRKGEVNLSRLQYTPTFGDDDNDEWLHFVYHDLSDKDKVIFEHRTGFGGRLSNSISFLRYLWLGGVLLVK